MKQNNGFRVQHFTFPIDSELGGVPQAVCLLSETMALLGITAEIYSFGNSARTLQRSKSLLERYNLARVKVICDENFFSSVYGIGNILTGLKTVFGTKSDLVVLHQIFTLSTIYGYLHARFRKIPLIVMPHGVFSSELSQKNRILKNFALKIFFNKVLKSAKYIIVTSKREADGLQTLNHQQVRVIPFGFFPQSSIPSMQNKSIRNIVLYVGRFSPEKNLLALIDAWAQVHPKYPSLELVLVGYRSVQEQKELYDKADSLNITGSISFIPWSPSSELKSLYVKTRCLVLPSISENFGLVVAEALSLGIPCVVTPAVPFADLITRYQAGVATSGMSASNIATAIQELVSKDQNEISLNATKLLNEQYNASETARSWRSLLSEFGFDSYNYEVNNA